MFKPYFKCITLSVFIVLLAGCARGPQVDETKFTSYEDFRPGPEGRVDLVWARDDIKDAQTLKAVLDKYDSVLVDRVFVVVKDAELDDESISELSDYMVMTLKEKISTNKRIVDEPSDSTLRLSIAISNVETPNPILAVTSSVLPFGIGVSTISKLTTGEHTNVGEATIELLVSDSKTAEPIFAVIDRHVGDKDLDNIVDGLSGAKDAIDWWVNRLFVTFDNQVTQI
ncbi:conserved exported hypothetical protein [Vibrio owensii]|uniref:DUF3313 domain-containing protein n=1 Tax=Vibrio owensii TaxID=696485 RepID=A0AAU9Q4C8_9VIBR|nr:conserved exported hypothetical protein [Vibrio owensii]